MSRYSIRVNRGGIVAAKQSFRGDFRGALATAKALYARACRFHDESEFSSVVIVSDEQILSDRALRA